jgi:hypothetical protein
VGMGKDFSCGGNCGGKGRWRGDGEELRRLLLTWRKRSGEVNSKGGAIKVVSSGDGARREAWEALCRHRRLLVGREGREEGRDWGIVPTSAADKEGNTAAAGGVATKFK